MAIAEQEITTEQSRRPRRVPRRLEKPSPPPRWTFHRVRRLTQLGCFLIFLTLPFLNVMRFDIPRQRFYFAGYELWINEFAIVFFSLMFLLFVIVAVSMIYGRLYCSYTCPQMIFSEASLALERKLRNTINKKFITWPARRRKLVVSALFYVIVSVASVFLTFVFISYFVEPRDLFWRLMSFDVRTAGGLAGAVTTLIVFLDFAFVRQRFCTTICPYGYLQGMLCDDATLIVDYRDKDVECIECRKCIRVCHMGIDIRKSPYQIECIHCGECVDACVDIMRNFGKPTLIDYARGDKGETFEAVKQTWRQRLGLRDAKRVMVLLLILFYAGGLFTALSMRRNVLVRVAPIRTTLYRIDEEGQVLNRFRLSIANRGHQEATINLSLKDLPGARFTREAGPLQVKAGETVENEFEIAAGASALRPGINRFEIIAHAQPGEAITTFLMTFITPEEKRPQ